MDIKELQKIMQENGVVGAGGAGFPTYMKLTDKADTILMNCAECEPLLKLHRQLLEKHAYEIMKTFDMVAETVGASQAIIGIKKSYVQTINALNQHIEEFPRVKIHLLDEVYPMGDEVVLIYEATGRVRTANRAGSSRIQCRDTLQCIPRGRRTQTGYKQICFRCCRS